MKICKVEGCEMPVRCKELCTNHYSLYNKYGDDFINHKQRGKHHYMLNCPEYNSWTSMKTRCYNENRPNYDSYGRRGIKVCDRWDGIDGFKNFYKDMGKRPTPNHSLDRIDVNGDYEPSNCRWATDKEQANNKRLIKLTVEDRLRIKELLRSGKGTLRGLAREYGVQKNAITYWRDNEI